MSGNNFYILINKIEQILWTKFLIIFLDMILICFLSNLLNLILLMVLIKIQINIWQQQFLVGPSQKYGVSEIYVIVLGQTNLMHLGNQLWCDVNTNPKSYLVIKNSLISMELFVTLVTHIRVVFAIYGLDHHLTHELDGVF